MGSALVAGGGCYLGYRLGLGRRQGSARPVATEPPRPELDQPSVELAQIEAELGAKLSHLGGDGLAFDRRMPFAEVREILRGLGPVSVPLAVEVHPRHRPAYQAELSVMLDVGPEPGMVAQDARRRAEEAAMEVMPTPWTYTGLHVSRDTIVIDHGGELESVAAPPVAVGGGWTDSMWTMAQRGGVSSLHGRRPWVFVDDDVAWGLVVRVLESLASPLCQPHFEAREGCEEIWASLFVGPPVR